MGLLLRGFWLASSRVINWGLRGLLLLRVLAPESVGCLGIEGSGATGRGAGGLGPASPTARPSGGGDLAGPSIGGGQSG